MVDNCGSDVITVIAIVCWRVTPWTLEIFNDTGDKQFLVHRRYRKRTRRQNVF